MFVNTTQHGDANANVLIGGLGADTLSGAAGDDIIYDDLNATVSSENLYAGGNTDIYGQYISSTTDSTAGNDTLNGNDDVNLLNLNVDKYAQVHQCARTCISFYTESRDKRNLDMIFGRTCKD